jgi:phage shock protein E
MTFLQQNWPLFLIGLWLFYRWWNSRKISALLPELKKNGAYLIDVRTAEEYLSGHAPGTKNIPVAQLQQRLNELPKDATIVLGCASGTRSGMAKMILKKNGYTRLYNIGTWTKFLN